MRPTCNSDVTWPAGLAGQTGMAAGSMAGNTAVVQGIRRGSGPIEQGVPELTSGN